jgi:hypothetical protein
LDDAKRKSTVLLAKEGEEELELMTFDTPRPSALLIDL